MRATPDEELTRELLAALPYLPGGDELGRVLDAELEQKILAAMPGLKERAKTLVELLDGARYLYATRPLELDEKARGLLDEEGRRVLGSLLPSLETAEPWQAGGLEALVKGFSESAGLKLGKVAQPLRAALTGRATSPGIFDVLTSLGREESLARIRDQATAA